jgi:hypothetical protein
MSVRYHQLRRTKPSDILSSRRYKGNNAPASFYFNFVTISAIPVRDWRTEYGEKKHEETTADAEAHL